MACGCRSKEAQAAKAQQTQQAAETARLQIRKEHEAKQQAKENAKK